MVAMITFAGRVSGIGHFDRHSAYRCFVLAETSQLPERPTSQNYPLRLPNLYPVHNTAQVFKSDTASGAFGCRNNLLRNTMIHVAGKTRLFARQFAKAPSCALCLFLLKFSPQSAVTITNGFDCLTAVVPAVRIAGDISDSEVHAKEIVRVSRIWLLNITGSRQEPITAMEKEIGFPLATRQQSQLPLPSGERYLNPPIQSAKRYGLPINVPPQITIIERYAAQWLKPSLRFFVDFISISDLCRAAHSDLRRDTKSIPQFPVGNLLKGVLRKGIFFPRLIAQPITGPVRRAKQLIKRSPLFGVGQQFNFSGNLQLSIIIKY
jgi:hypothetical protein